MTDRIFVALPIALLVESAPWLRLRWNFDNHAFIRAWQVSILSAGATAVVIWLDGDRFTALHRIIGWLPALFLPVQFTQSFGMRKAMPLSTFSFFARQRQLRNQRLGLPDTSTHLNFGNVYFVCCLLGATLGSQAGSLFFLPGLLLLIGWLLLSSGQTRWLPLAAALTLAGFAAVSGQKSLTNLYERAVRYSRTGSGDENKDPNVTETAIGRLGEIKQSPAIRWRLSTDPGQPVPRLLRLANFNRYVAGKWKNERALGLGPKSDFLSLDEQQEGNNHYVFRSQEEQPDPPADLPRFSLRGSVKEEDQLPLPGDTAAIGGFALDSVLHNSLGTIRIIPKNSVISGTVRWRHHPQLENTPMKEDGIIPPAEEKAVRLIAAELGLANEPTLAGKMDIIGKWFAKEFRYTRYLTIESETGQGFSSAMSKFLLETRRGHCEYFATSAALLLRAAGIPTRYSLGYIVREEAPNGDFYIRGTHAHAWCRAWDAETSTWIDFDATPGDWLALEGRREARTQWLSDLYQRVREDFGLWRTDPVNRSRLAIGMAAIGAVVFTFVGRRLWKSKSVLADTRKDGSSSGPGSRTPLHELEPLARNLLGPRPPGLPFARWLSGLRASITDPGELDEAILLHQRLRYDPQPPASSPEDRLGELVRGIKSQLKPL